MSLKVICLICFIGISGCLIAATPGNAEPAPDTAVVKTQNFDPFVASQKYLDTLSPEKKKSSDAYFEGGYWLILWGLVAEIIVALIFLSFGLSQWVKKIAIKVRNRNLQNLVYALFYLLFSFLITFPLEIYQGFFREHQYKLSNLSLTDWLDEEMITLGLTLFIGSILIMLIYIAIRKVRQKWWIWGSVIVVGFMLIGQFIYPIYIAPLFNSYKPLTDEKIKNEILSMARSNGVHADEVYQFDASKQNTKISANVSGFGSTIRISLNDNLLNKCTKPEIKAVMGHELGHYVMNHIYTSLVYFGVLVFLAFFLVNLLFNKIWQKWGSKWKIADLSDISGLPLFIVLFALMVTLATPISNNITRVMEIEADYFGLNVAREPDGFASVAMKLSEYRKISPGRWEEIIFYDHPSGKTRVFNAMKWKSENLNK
jgi:STE24 endopeptidase